MAAWRSSSQSSAASSSASATAPRPSASPRLEDAVAGDSVLAAASLETGSRMRPASMARTRSRQRLPSGPRRRSGPILRAVPSAAATWPCGRLRVTVKASCSAGMTVPPLSTPRKPSTWAGDQPERLHSVRLRTLPAWRSLSRSRMAGGEFRFGTASIYMAEAESFGRPVQVTNALLHGYKLRRVEAVFPGIPPIYSNGKSEARVKSVHKTCDPTGASDLRRMNDAVHLETRCDGSGHDGCDARCLLFWKTAWLKPADGPAQATVPTPAPDAAALALLQRATRAAAKEGGERYSCQVTEIVAATVVIPNNHLRHYFE